MPDINNVLRPLGRYAVSRQKTFATYDPRVSLRIVDHNSPSRQQTIEYGFDARLLYNKKSYLGIFYTFIYIEEISVANSHFVRVQISTLLSYQRAKNHDREATKSDKVICKSARLLKLYGKSD